MSQDHSVMRIVIAGAGRMGQAIAARLDAQDDLELVGTWQRGGDLATLVAASDVVVDFSLPVKAKGPSPLWYQIVMWGLMGVGLVVILLNYMDVLPGGTDSKYLLVGLAGIGIGFAMTMNYR